MNAPLNEPPALSLQIGTLEMESYLARAGWSKTMSSRVAQLWVSDHPQSSNRIGDVEVLVPNIPAAPDFQTRLKILLSDLEAIEQRPIDQIRDEMTRQFIDVTDIKAEHDLDSSVFPLDASQKLFSSAKKMIIAAAAASLKRRGYFGHSVPKRARDQARGVLVGHTRPGSYVVPIISRARLPNAEWQGDRPYLVEEVEEASFDRRMVVTLSKALDVLHDLAVESEHEPSNRDVNESVSEGLSYELCDGVIRTLRDSAVQDFTVGFNWAPAVPQPSSTSKTITFPSECLPRLRQVARGLRKDVEDKQQVVYGWVEVLASRAQDVGGWVRVHAMVNGRQRIIRMNLDEEDYQKAVDSHKKYPVMVRGDLHLEEGKQATMDVHSFEFERPLPGV